MSDKNNNKKLTKKELLKISAFYLISSQWNWNYERMMSSGYLAAVLPALKKFYGDDPETLKQMMEIENQFFNTNADFGNLIIGIDLAIQQEEGIKAKETVANIKTALMGSLAGVGDALFHVIWGTVFGSLAATMALQGSAVGIIIWIVANILRQIARIYFAPLGFSQGTKLVTTFKDKLNAFTGAATVMGITVIGSLIPSVIRANVPAVFVSGEREVVIQEVLNQIMPALVPVVLLAATYWLLGRKNMNSTRVIWVVLIASIILYNFGILG